MPKVCITIIAFIAIFSAERLSQPSCDVMSLDAEQANLFSGNERNGASGVLVDATQIGTRQERNGLAVKVEVTASG